MNRFLFPSNYKPDVDFLSTIKYIDIYKKQLTKFLQEEFNALFITAPTASNITNSYNTSYVGQRRINFDNRYAHTAYQINSVFDNYFRLLLDDFSNTDVKALISTFFQNKRDSLLTNLDSFSLEIIHLEYNTLLEEHNTENFKNWFKKFWKQIYEINNDDSVKIIYSNNEKFENEIKFINLQTIVELYPLLPIQKAFNLYCAKHKVVGLLDPFAKMLSGQYFCEGLPTADNFSCSCILYVYSPIHSEALPIIKIASRPAGQLAKDQLLQLAPSVYDSNLMNKKIFEKNFIQTIGFTFYFSNLMLINLKKIHLAEVISSVWTKDFEDFLKLENIKVM